MKKIISILLIIVILSFVFPVYADEDDGEIITSEDLEEILQVSSNIAEEPKLNSRSAIIFDRKSKDIIYAKQENTKRPMASTTKIMTAIIVLENANLDDIVETSRKAAGVGGSNLGFSANAKISVRDLMYGLMLCSRK